MRLDDAERASETAQELVELLAAYEQELVAWERWTPAAAPLRAALDAAICEARSLIQEAAPAAPAGARAH